MPLISENNMSKKLFIFIILILIAIFGGVYWYLFSTTKTTPSEQGTTAGNNDLFPFGQGGTSGNQQPTTTTTDNNGNVIDLGGDSTQTPPRLRHISLVPTAGAVIFDVSSTTTNIRYTERATGHVYETSVDNTEVNKISAVTIPKVYEALWSTDGSKLLMRYLKDDNQTIRTFYAKIATTTKPEQALEGLFLADGIKNVSVFGNKIFYTNEASNGAEGVTANIDGSGKKAVFSSAFSDWSSIWTSANTITLFTRPSGQAEGSAYTLNPLTGEYIKTIGDIKGLTTLGNTDGSQVLLSRSNSNSLTTGVYTVKSSDTQVLGINTLTDKCVWSAKVKTIVLCAVPQSIPNGTYPDDWYKGKVSFNDALWKIDIVSGDTEQVFVPEFETGVSMDMIKLSLNQSEKTILFTNKKDMTVWSYNIVQ